MPRLSQKKQEGIISLDTECTGRDFHHGTRPFLVTICRESYENTWWQWEVDPLTRKVRADRQDLLEIQEAIDRAEYLVGQNVRFDVKGLSLIFRENGLELKWPWNRTRDTLIAGHLLASDQPHDLTSMVLIYCQLDIKPLEDSLKTGVSVARRIVKQRLPSWRIAQEGLSDMPSVKNGVGADYWLPRAVVLEAVRSLRFDLLPKDPRQPRTGRTDKCSVRIDRGTKWGNPFIPGKDGTREEVIRKFTDYILGSSLLAELPELYNQTLGCYCSPQLCHGDILSALCHPWFTVCQEYANGDSSSTLAVWEQQNLKIKSLGLEKVYDFRMKLPEAITRMEAYGVTADLERTNQLKLEFTESAKKHEEVCVSLSGNILKEMPKGISNALRSVLYDHFALKPVRKTKNGIGSADQASLETWLGELEENSPAYQFISSMLALRKRQTALKYIKSYEKFWIPDARGKTIRMFPTVNPTGSRTLRMSSENPNEQQISGKTISEQKMEKGRSIRWMFGPAPGREWWTLDYQNLELRIPAYKADEMDVVWIFDHPNDPPYFGSYHLAVCDLLFPELFQRWGKQFKDEEPDKYHKVKCTNFGIIYGCAPDTADRTCRYPGAFKKIEHRFPKIAKLRETQIKLANRHRYIETVPDSEVDTSRGYPLYCERTRGGGVLPTQPLNYFIQGTACWLATSGMLACDEGLVKHNSNRPPEKHGHLFMYIHDELAFDLPKIGDPVEALGKGDLARRRTNIPLIIDFKRMMEKSGDRIGVPTPVEVKYHPRTWAEGVRMDLVVPASR